ncbi:FdtA/QdtA family cupin domain-containing protein [Akkermansiaceae bacterium]|jgi:dTDP-4-dehydrorhamnose 3,5-epimerase-like enzyme|nr:FdtA/QdtA family cupin domain-containing protein [Akkermansiaceae bacterium]MDB4357937.1 FdtA/QdtA family cupin domain-containing protein [bacterium]MDA7891090.1 FdtA/QdtA family cupin domain-containing protein [Akkermansiaceae bacterium]MDA7908154.1 FdtA/QdtA family cupin domain-containing protein [Akkermansiaceae bacterium]MDA7930336.1 FdtA/QdtA family cupin domain-containing protein [Akkermansiaceae bacterium]
MNLTTINFKPLGDARGSLVAIESDLGIPFPIRRVYYIFDTKTGVERGFHAHKKLQQIAVAVTGSCEMILDDGKEKESVCLDSSTKGLYIGPGFWRVMRNFTPDCVLLVLADRHYDESEYIRNYDEFLEWKKS